MTSAEILKALNSGSRLCMEHGEDGKPVYWLSPGSQIIHAETAQSIIKSAGLKPQRDSLFRTASQTWALDPKVGA